MMRNIILTLVLLLLSMMQLISQVAINYDGSEPTSHTLLDLKSDTTGLLIPRLSHTQVGVLANKLDNTHKGMVIFNNTAKLLCFWDGTEFIYMQSGIISMIRDDDNDTYIDTEYGTDPDEIEVVTGGTIYWTYKDGRINVTNTGKSIFLGENAGLNDDLSDNNNVFLGHNAGSNNTEGEQNIAIGAAALYSSNTKSKLIAIGDSALYYNGTNVSYSFQALDNIAIGSNSQKHNTTGYTNVSVGNSSLYSNTSGQRNNAFGYQSMKTNTTGYDNTAFGFDAMKLNTSGHNNIAIGSEAMESNTTGYRNIAVGSDALFNILQGNHNIAIGVNTLYNLTNGVQNVSIGYESSKENTMGHYNTSIGSYAMNKNTTGQKNVVLGYSAGYYIDDGSNNVMIGYRAGRGVSSSAKSGNIFLGYEAGYNETGNNKLYIQNSNSSDPLIYGDFDTGSLGLLGNVGIGTKTPLAELQVHSIANSLSSLYITPSITGSGDSAMVFLAEDHNATYGMYWLYDGNGNELELWGKSSATFNGPHLIIKRDNGDVAIGQNFATGYKLSVDGKVICEELRVNLQADWPDYVFKNDYKLMPVKELESFIQDKGHLPNVPPASEIESSGLEVGETQRVMMEKIEELTLYIIEQQKQIDELKEQLK